jgi:O-antigen ligase
VPGSSRSSSRRHHPSSDRSGGFLRGAIEALTLALVAVAPWPFGSANPYAEGALYAGVAALLALWAVRLLVEGRGNWKRCPVTLCLAGLVLFTAWQLLPLSPSAVQALSPAGAALSAELLPTPPNPAVADATTLPAGASLSLYPGATRPALVQLTAVLALFAVVRQNLTSTRNLRRLSVVALANGVLLSLFALLQAASSPRNELFWSVTTEGTAFGAFVCRNHFPFYINVCLGLGLGLLLTSWPEDADRIEGFRLLQSSAVVWAGVALALLVGAVFLSLSRGGVLALLGAAAVLAVVAGRRAFPWPRLVAFALIAALTLGLVSWYGKSVVGARLAALWQDQRLEEARPQMWARVLPLAGQYPFWGTGAGTFADVEPLTRGPEHASDAVWEHAHNEYLEALVEGGVVRLGLTLAAVGFVYYLGGRALRRADSRSARPLALGALFGVTAVVLHSAGDFGLHIPAVALLVTVLCAELCAVGAGEARHHHPPDARPASAWGRGAAVLGALAALAPAVVLVHEGWRLARVEGYRAAAAGAPWGRQLALFGAAVEVMPEDAALRMDLAETYFATFQEAHRSRARRDETVLAVQTLLAAIPKGQTPGEWAACLCSPPATAGALQAEATKEEERFRTDYAGPGVWQCLIARQSCPLMLRPHMRLAAYANPAAVGEPARAHLDRARRLAPADAEVWYLAGAEELHEGQAEEAWRCWRRSLECGDRFLEAVLRQAKPHLSAEEIADRLLPDQPRVLAAAAARLEPEAVKQALRTRAVRLLKAEKDPPTEDLCLRAELHAGLGQFAEAAKDYEAALDHMPFNHEWRFALAKVLFANGQRERALGELRFILATEPSHTRAKQLQEDIVRAKYR